LTNKVLHICYSGAGGQPNVAINLAHYGNINDSEYCHQMLFCGVEDLHITNSQRCHQNGVFFQFLRKKRGLDLLFFYKLFRILRSHDCNVIVAHINTFHFLLWLYKKLSKVKIISVEHHSVALRSATSWAHTQMAVLCSDRVVTLNSEASKVISNQIWFRNDCKMVVIPNGVEASSINKRGLTVTTKVTLGVACRLEKGKDLVTVLRAFEQLPHAQRDFSLLIAGDGSDKQMLFEMASMMHIGHKIIFLGMLGTTEMQDFYREADILIVSSQGEGFGMTVIEAFANGIPCIASNVTGINSLISDGENGLLFEYANDNDLCSKIMHLLDQPQTAAKLIENGLLLHKQDYSLDSSYAKYRNLFKL
jgi:glycosyltransferase involved in cell wall biosynthesis